jgi:putative transposase
VCAGLDEQVEAFRTRPLEGRYPYLWLDAKVEKVRDGGRVVRKCLVIAHAVHESGRREVIGLDCGECETEAFWREFLRGLVKRGLAGVQLVVSDAHEGLKQAIGQVLGAPWQRCTVHFLREALGHARKEQQPMLAALIRPIFNAETGEQARELLGEAIERLERPLPKVAAMLERAEEDLLAFYAFPVDHWRKLRSTNPLERLNREIGRRTDAARASRRRSCRSLPAGGKVDAIVQPGASAGDLLLLQLELREQRIRLVGREPQSFGCLGHVLPIGPDGAVLEPGGA